MAEKGKIMKTKKKNRVFEDLVQGFEEIKKYQKLRFEDISFL